MQRSDNSSGELSSANNVASDGTEGTSSIVRNSAILRGIGALLIIARHTLGRASSTDDVFLRPVCVLVSQFGCYAIPLFLVLSGFSLSLGAGERPRFRKYGHIVLRKILPAFTIWYFVYATLMAIKHSKSVDILSLLSAYVHLADTGHLWFLVLLIQLYLLFPLLRRFYTHPILGRFTVVFVITIVYLVEDLFQSEGSLAFASPYLGRLVSFNSVFFVLGFYLKDYAAVFTQYSRKSLVVLACLSTFGFLEAYRVNRMFRESTNSDVPDLCDLRSVIGVVSTIVALVLLYLISDWIQARCVRVRSYLSSYGLYSYGIYLAHVVPMALSYSVLRLFIHADNDAVVVGNMIATVILTKLMVKGLSKMPFSEYYV
jgi:surface polysaccharide O-acyltransferase-like enzyme